MFCTKCGNELAEGSAFCSSCGNPVNQSPAPVARSTTPAEATSGSASAGVAATRKKPVFPIALAVIVVAIIGVAVFTGGFGLLSDSSSNESVEEADANMESENNAAEFENSTESDEISVEVKSTVEEYTWEELSAISAEIATASDENEAIEIAKKYNLVNDDGTLDGTQTKSVTLSDGTVTSVQIAGFLHDDKSDGSGKAGITFIFADGISEMYMNFSADNTGGWESSKMRSWLASRGKARLPEELQDVIVAVDKSTNNVGNTASASSVTTTSDELWLFSRVELAGEVDESDLLDWYKYTAAIYNAEGSQYKLFRDCGVNLSNDSNDILTKTYQGARDWWWERSSSMGNDITFLNVDRDGGLGSSGNANNSHAIVPGFCI